METRLTRFIEAFGVHKNMFGLIYYVQDHTILPLNTQRSTVVQQNKRKLCGNEEGGYMGIGKGLRSCTH